jgi:menaquinone-dependent protoporphyrinogen IX oxidase
VKKLLIPVSLFGLSGCAVHVEPVTAKFPEAPATLLQKCEDLKEATEGMQLSEFTKVVVGNYILYHECSRKVEGWHEWYQKQKAIFEQATK